MKIIFIIFLLISIFFIQGKPTYIPAINENEKLYALYDAVNDTLPASTNKNEIIKIIEDRLNCYKESHLYSWRSNVCITKYTDEIVQIGRKNLHSTPIIENFINTVVLCPVIFNMCISAETMERCEEFERQCIDFAFDNNWRGRDFFIISNPQE